MTFDLAITPAGRITTRQIEQRQKRGESTRGNGTPNVRWSVVAKAFASNQAEGLFELATASGLSSFTPSCIYWRDFAGRYLTELCHAPDGATQVAAIPPPESGDLDALLLNVPPMQGGEYVSCEHLENIWRGLDQWVRNEVTTSGEGLSSFLSTRAPLWHQVGRVCFHLAENRNDPDYPFAFLVTYTPNVANGGRLQHHPLSKALQQYAGVQNRTRLIKLLSPIHEASQASRLIRDLVESSEIYEPLAWTPRQAHRFLKEVPIFEQSGVLVQLPAWWRQRPRPTVNVTIGDQNQKRFDTQSMLDFKVQLILGDRELGEAEWQQIAAGEDGLVMLQGQWIEVDRGKLTQALEHWKEVEQNTANGISFVNGMRLLAGAPTDLIDEPPPGSDCEGWSFVNAGQWLGETLANLRNPENLKHARPGADLHATLRGYQKTGVSWLWFMSSLGIGACLADDMGLGKTIQVLALLLRLKKEPDKKPSLLVLPASLLANWKSEMSRFAPTLRARFVHPSQADKDELTHMAENPDRAVKNTDVVATTYGMLLRHPWLLEIEWRVVVVDEAQAIKNPAARQTKTVKRLGAQMRIALTGTPVENRLSDLWSLFDFLCPGLLGSREKFKHFVKSLDERDRDRYAPLRRLVQPYILRRLKTDKQIIADLPDKTEVYAFCGLTKRQSALYAKLVRELSTALRGLGGIKRRGLVLVYLMRFKQLCNHPSHLLGDGRYDPEDSGKFARLAEICEEIESRQEKVLIFTQFREMTEPLSEFLSGVFRCRGLVLHGGTPVKQRKSLIDTFQSDDGPPFFVLSLKAGGTGLNLTAASHVIHFDRWWNPAVENQATDRAFRIGQNRNVLVHKFVCQGTIEEKIDALIESKTQLATNLLEGNADKMLTEMTDSELIQLVSLDIERASL